MEMEKAVKAIELLNRIKSECLPNNAEPSEEVLKKHKQLLSMIENKDVISKMEKYVYEFIYLPIYNVLDENERNEFENIVVDSVPIHKINARAMKTDENEYLIIITNRLMALLHTWNELQIKIGMTKDISKEEASRAFAPIIDSYLTPNSNYALPVFSLEEIPLEYLELATIKTMMHEKFILAHELAHKYLGHLKEAKGISSFVSDFTILNFYENSENIEKEFEADIQAVKWLSRLEGADIALTMYVEALVIFHFIECNTGFPSPKSSHPASLLRLFNLKKNCNEYFVNCKYTLDEMIHNCLDVESFKITAP